MKYNNKQTNQHRGLGWLIFSIIMAVTLVITVFILYIQNINFGFQEDPNSNLQKNDYVTKTPAAQAEETVLPDKESYTAAETLAMIDKYQSRYFIIVKRNDMFLQGVDCGGCAKDTKDLSDLYTEVISKIDTNNSYFIKYKEIENEFAENTGETTYDMNMFANSHYEAVDKLLNEVYQAVKAKIPTEDFKNLTSSELMWIKEVEAYQKVFEAQGYGTLGTLKYLGYKTDMHRFRTLLLILYL